MAQPFWGLNMLNQALDQRSANALARRQLEGQEQQNALSGQVRQAQIGKLNREEALAKLKTAGPLAKAALEDPSSYPQIRTQYMELTGEELPEMYQEAEPLIRKAAQVYDRINPPDPIDLEYQTAAGGEVVALPTQVRPGQDITPLRTGVMAQEKEGPLSPVGKLVEDFNRGRLSPEQFGAAFAKQTQQRNTRLSFDPATGSITFEEGPIGGQQTKGRTAADRAFGQEYVDWRAKGGFADAAKQLSQLKEVEQNLRSGANLTGPLIGSMPDLALKFTNPEAISTREAVEEVVQRNLKSVLGGQFTEREGEKLVQRAFNPNLSEEENSKRVERLIAQIETAARMKEDAADYWEQNGTLTGWEGKLYTMDDFLNIDFGQEKTVDTLPQGAKQIGTYQGKPVFETPDGRRLIQE